MARMRAAPDPAAPAWPLGGSGSRDPLGSPVAVAGRRHRARRSRGPLRTAPLCVGASRRGGRQCAARRAPRRAGALLLGGALAAAERAGLDAARDALRPWADDRAEETLSGRVAAPVEDDGRALRFALGSTALRRPVRGTARRAAGPGPGLGLPRSGRRGLDAAAPAGRRVEVHRRSAHAARLSRARARRRPARWAAARGAAALLSPPTGPRVSGRREGSALDPWRAAALLQRRLADGSATPPAMPIATASCARWSPAISSAMSERDAARYRDSGASHVLAVSGLHLAAVALLAFAAVRRLWAAVPALALRVEPARAAALVAAPLAVAYTMVTGAPPSAVRALWVVLLFLAGVALDRRVRLRDALGAAALLMLAARPSSLFDPVGPALASPPPPRWPCSGPPRGRPGRAPPWPARAWRGLRQLVIASLWTWAATAPISAFHFGQSRWPGRSPTWWRCRRSSCGAAARPGRRAARPSCGRPAARRSSRSRRRVTERVPRALGQLVGVDPAARGPAAGSRSSWPRWCAAPRRAAPPRCGPRTAAPPPPARTPGRRRGRCRSRRVLAVARRAGPALARGAARRLPRRRAGGRGGGRGCRAAACWLIDAGGLPFARRPRDPAAARRAAEAPGREAVARYLAARRIRRIDLVILSHAHPDHYRGLAAVARTRAIDELWLARPHPDAPLGGELARAARRAGGARHAWCAARRPAPCPAQGGAALDRAGARRREAAWPRSIRSDRRTTTRWWCGSTSPAAASSSPATSRRRGRRTWSRARGAAELARRPGQGAAPRLARPRRRRRWSPPPRPRWAVISCGLANRFGFPHEGVEERWEGRGGRVMRTDLGGTITFVIDGGGRMSVESVVGDGGW